MGLNANSAYEKKYTLLVSILCVAKNRKTGQGSKCEQREGEVAEVLVIILLSKCSLHLRIELHWVLCIKYIYSIELRTEVYPSVGDRSTQLTKLFYTFYVLLISLLHDTHFLSGCYSLLRIDTE